MLIGSGGREHALARALAADPATSSLLIVPGNPGMEECGTCVPADILDGDALTTLALAHDIDCAVIGPEAPLVAGVADALRAAGIAVFGPSAAAAQLEGSKHFAKEVMAAAGVPTARSFTCHTLDAARTALAEFSAPYVVKDNGLAAGKGVVVTPDLEAAISHAAAILAHPDGAVVIEEFMDGQEFSLFFLCDGTHAVPLLPAQDFKRAYDGDAGPNTGGMGAYAPVPWVGPELIREVTERVALPTLAEMAYRGMPFTGLLYCGLMLTGEGPKVVEFNVRFGDPETEAILPLLASPLGQVLASVATGNAADLNLQWYPGVAVGVVLAAPGYPAAPEVGAVIEGLDDAGRLAAPVSGTDLHLVHAGTRRGVAGEIVSSGGRVGVIVARGETFTEARTAVYKALETVSFPGMHYRRDIAALPAGQECPR